MSEDDPMVILSEVAEIIPGTSPQGKDINSSGVGLPFYQGSKEFGSRHPKAERFTLAPVKTAVAGDVLLSVRAPVGRVNVADSDCAIGRGVMAVRARAPEDGPYVAAVFESMSGSWDAHATDGTMFANLSKAGLERLPVRWPTDRARIAEVLGALDDRIEASARRIGLFEDLIQCVFAATAEIEAEDVRLLEHLRFGPGKNAPRDIADSGKGVPVYGANGRIGGTDTTSWSVSGAALVGKIGSCGAINWPHAPAFWPTNNCHVVSYPGDSTGAYAFAVVSQVDFAPYVGGSAHPYMPRANLAGATVYVPTAERIPFLLDRLTEAGELRAREIGALAAAREARDFLLPRLISGELRVAEAEKTVEGVL